ncbi:hypothetical protein K488DRAFT_85711 [Vararia minispora EC-137]|uniref:Uncharacterized protein n=1 Tax=Vararia minispora EC-137 TaxID=1314806 RepID=A0ACB8QLU7_9AGAM|nr:hypothetical protein K488DRAFT_85711 [Vararia minispora EC-137]
MTDFVRRLVSGNRTRFRDAELDLELDLTYITDNIIVMGYPAIGVEGFYRNRREDAKKFLDTRHGSNYWVFNFCPMRENTYDASVFHGRVSRYPFPDHHAPPLAILALTAREMRLWLDGSHERVAVLHCKAGKGRSGTLACAYLLTLDDELFAPQLERNYSKKELEKLKKPIAPPSSVQQPSVTGHAGPSRREETIEQSWEKKEWATERVKELINEMPADDAPMPPTQDPDTDMNGEALGASASTTSLPGSSISVSSPQTNMSTDPQKLAKKTQANGVDVHGSGKDTPATTTQDTATRTQVAQVLDGPHVTSLVSKSTITSTLPSSTISKGAKDLASVLDFHTSRRIKPNPSSPFSSSPPSSSSSGGEEKATKPQEVEHPGPPPKQGRAQGVSISSQRRFLWYWSLVLANEAPEGFWPPLPYPPTAPDYDPQPLCTHVRVVNMKVCMRGANSIATGAVKAATILLGHFGDSKETRNPADVWVSLARYEDKFVDTLERWERWGRERGVGVPGRRRADSDEMPATNSTRRQNIHSLFKDGVWDDKKMVRSFARLIPREGKQAVKGKVVTEILAPEAEVTIDANREVRFKLYMGKIFMAWMWLIPAFHLPGLSADGAYDPITLVFTKADLDFPIGLGASLVDVAVTLQRVHPSWEAPSSPCASSGHEE